MCLTVFLWRFESYSVSNVTYAVQTNRHNGDFTCRDVIVTVAIWGWIS